MLPGSSTGFYAAAVSFEPSTIPDGHLVLARGINDAGDIVGTYQRPGEERRRPCARLFLFNTARRTPRDSTTPGNLNTIPQRRSSTTAPSSAAITTPTRWGLMHGMMFQRGFSAIDMECR
jgi:hypothetical protein